MTDDDQLDYTDLALIPGAESMTVEFKSDVDRLSDDDIVLAAVCLANSQGGILFVGVEDDGTPTGLHGTRPPSITGLAALISNRTAPALSCRIGELTVAGHRVAEIEVPQSRGIVATSAGTIVRRRLKQDGTPECVPYLPHEHESRMATFGAGDRSTSPVAGATLDDLDSVERSRLRRFIEAQQGGDAHLLDLDDSAFDGALGLITQDGQTTVPTLAGLLMIGKEESLRRLVPTHEVLFQVLDGTDVLVNDSYRIPLGHAVERLESQFEARVVETEVNIGMFRVPVPTVDRRAFREALVNAMVHRDYTQLGAIHVQWTPTELTMASPGGLIDGVRLDNLLTVPPKPRNPALADAFKRLGLAERTGRGIDLMYQGMLRYGRPAPSFARTDDTTVVVELSCAAADVAFLEVVLEFENRTQRTLDVPSLLVLDLLRAERKVDVARAAEALQRDVPHARSVLARLVEGGLVDQHGTTRGREYSMSAAVYERLGTSAGYVRQAGFDFLQQEQMVRAYVDKFGEIRRTNVMELCRLNSNQAARLLNRLKDAEIVQLHGTKRTAFYTKGPKF